MGTKTHFEKEAKGHLEIIGLRGAILNPLHPKTQCLIDFSLSNARQFYLSEGEPLGLKGIRLRKQD